MISETSFSGKGTPCCKYSFNLVIEILLFSGDINSFLSECTPEVMFLFQSRNRDTSIFRGIPPERLLDTP